MLYRNAGEGRIQKGKTQLPSAYISSAASSIIVSRLYEIIYVDEGPGATFLADCF
jgi:hypothetical protein